jgi:ATP-dependent Clp protease adaptor protein ClpS
MEELLYLAVSAAGMVTLWWRHRRRAGAGRRRLPPHDEEIEVILHVAAHEARARRQPMRPEHLLLALVESESVSAAIQSSGGEPSAVEDRVFTALEGAGDEALLYTMRLDPAAAAIELAAALARHHGRSASSADLWFALMRPGLGLSELVSAAGVDPTAVLFVLAHGAAERAGLDATDDAEIELVLVNDDFSPQQLVVEVLREGLGLPEDEAHRLMLAAHSEGRASLGRHPGARARKTAEATRSRARRLGYPLWIQLIR